MCTRIVRSAFPIDPDPTPSDCFRTVDLDLPCVQAKTASAEVRVRNISSPRTEFVFRRGKSVFESS